MKFTLSLILALFINLLYGQVYEEWDAFYTGPDDQGSQQGHYVLLDEQGNVYVGGTSYGSDSTSYDFVLIKYNSNGSELWVARYDGGHGYDGITGIDIDLFGNVYVTGRSRISYHFDFVTIKYDDQGNVIWERRYDGPVQLADDPVDLVVDNFGSIIVTGESAGLDSIKDFLTIKYDPNGDTIWTRRFRMTDTLSCFPKTIEVDSFDNIYVAGDCFPGFSVVKYNTNGDIIWTNNYKGDSGIGRLNAMKIDQHQNVFFTGIYNGKYTTIKLNANGLQQWVSIYNSPDDNFNEPFDIDLDADNNIYITGVSDGDPSGSVKRDIVTIKYDFNGIEQWVRRNDGINHGDDFGYVVAVDAENSIIVAGQRDGAYYTISYNANGEVQWDRMYDDNSASECEARDIEIDCKGNVYVTGWCDYQTDADRITTVKYARTEPFNCFVGLEEAERDILEIYPNPVNDHLNINNVAHEDVFTLYGLLGEVVFKSEINPGSYRIGLPGLPRGIYLYKLTSGLKSGKLIFQ